VELQNRSMLLVRDMTETRELQKKALFAEKFQLLSEAAIAVNHEINNPLTTIKSQLYLMLNDKDSSLRQKDRQRLQTLLENSDRIADVIQKFEQLETLESVNYLGDLKMLNLRPDQKDAGSQDQPPKDQN
jgi:signal transduction histidine kinase